MQRVYPSRTLLSCLGVVVRGIQPQSGIILSFSDEIEDPLESLIDPALPVRARLSLDMASHEDLV